MLFCPVRQRRHLSRVKMRSFEEWPPLYGDPGLTERRERLNNLREPIHHNITYFVVPFLLTHKINHSMVSL